MTKEKTLKNMVDNSHRVFPKCKSFLRMHIFLISDLIILLLIITGISFFQNRADKILLFFWVFIAMYTLSLRRYLSFIHLIISTCIAFIWVSIARINYGYNYNYYTVAGMNLLPIMAWALGMIGILEIFNHFAFKNKIVRVVTFIIIFWIVLILIETYAFHVIGIRNTATGTNIGLPFCDCIHAPWWMRIVYFTLGPAYYGITIISDQYTDSIFSKKVSNSLFS